MNSSSQVERFIPSTPDTFHFDGQGRLHNSMMPVPSCYLQDRISSSSLGYYKPHLFCCSCSFGTATAALPWRSSFQRFGRCQFQLTIFYAEDGMVVVPGQYRTAMPACPISCRLCLRFGRIKMKMKMKLKMQTHERLGS